VPFWLYSQDKSGAWVPGLARGRIHTQPDEAVLEDNEPPGARRTYSHERGAPEDLDTAYRALIRMLKLDVGDEQALMGERGFLRSELERVEYRSRSGVLGEDAIKAVRLSIASRLYPGWDQRYREQRALHASLASATFCASAPASWAAVSASATSDSTCRMVIASASPTMTPCECEKRIGASGLVRKPATPAREPVRDLASSVFAWSRHACRRVGDHPATSS